MCHACSKEVKSGCVQVTTFTSPLCARLYASLAQLKDPDIATGRGHEPAICLANPSTTFTAGISEDKRASHRRKFQCAENPQGRNPTALFRSVEPLGYRATHQSCTNASPSICMHSPVYQPPPPTTLQQPPDPMTRCCSVDMHGRANVESEYDRLVPQVVVYTTMPLVMHGTVRRVALWTLECQDSSTAASRDVTRVAPLKTLPPVPCCSRCVGTHKKG